MELRVPNPHHAPRFLYRVAKFPPRIIYALGLGPLIGRLVLLLTTTGRKTGLKRVTPLQYEELDGVIYVGAVRGPKTDWYRNIVANPNVEVRVKRRHFHGIAEPISDITRIADFLALGLERHPRLVGAMLRADGVPANPTRADLEGYAARATIVTIHPVEDEARCSSVS